MFNRLTGAVAVPLILTASLALSNAAFAQEKNSECEALFVQTAKKVEMTADTLTLSGVSPLVTFFCDRPVRHAGHVTNAEYLDAWDHGKDTFDEDPPNAMISMLDGDDADDVVVELLDKPVLDDDTFTYKIAIIQGDPIERTDSGTLFVDIIGRPLTPGSVAGISRRTTRRVVRRCAAGVTCW